MTTKSLTLPTNMKIFATSDSEPRLLYEEIFSNRCYLRHGIGVNPGDCIFDVGANIGLATLFFWRMQPQLSIFAFEPIPELFEILRCNIELHRVPAKAFNIGLSSRAGAAHFTYYPNNTVMSGMHADSTEDSLAIRTLLGNYGATQAFIERALRSNLEARDVTCTVSTLSQVIRREQVERIDLLKIDVEKSELDVIVGLEEEHWPRIRNLVVEVHDMQGRLAKMCEELRSRGFLVAAEQDDMRRHTGVYTVFARRA